MSGSTAAGEAGAVEDTAEHCGHAGNRPGARFCAHCGEAIPAEAEAAEGDDEGQADEADAGPDRAAVLEIARRRLSRWAGREERAAWARTLHLPRRVVVPLAVGLAVVVAAVLGLYAVQGRWYSPEEPARDLGAALQNGDGPAVAALLGVEAAAHPLLAPGALDTGFEPVTDWEVTGVEYETAGEWEYVTGGGGVGGVRFVEDYTKRKDMEHARVTVAYRLGGEARTAELYAVREASGWFRAWSLDPGPLESTLTATGRTTTALTLAGITVPEPEPANEETGEPAGDGALLAIPGVYTLTAPGDALWADAAETVALGLGADEYAGAAAEIRPEIPAEAEAAVRAHIDACAAGGGMPPGPCGFRDDSGWSFSIPNDAIWQVTAYPEIEVIPEPGGGGNLAISTITPGSAAVEYETILGDTRTITAEVHANGTATYSGGALEFQAQTCDIGDGYC